MTALAPTAPAPASAHVRTAHRLTFGHLLRSEAIKLVSLRSTWWSLSIAAALTVGIAWMFAFATQDVAVSITPVNVILLPTQFTMLVAGILGAIAVTGEYSTGMIRSTLTAEPRRGRVLAAKALVVGLLVAASTALTYAIAVVVTAPWLPMQIDWADAAQSSIPLAFGVLSMAVFALIGVGFGFIVRNGAGAIAATVGVLFILPIVLPMFSMAGESWQWLVSLTDYLPMPAAADLTAPASERIVPALLALGSWAAGLLVLGWVTLRGRDA